MPSDRSAILLAGLILLAACQAEEPENIQTRADNVSNMLENRAAEITAEAENGTNLQIAPLDNQAAAFADQVNAALGNGEEAQSESNKQ